MQEMSVKYAVNVTRLAAAGTAACGTMKTAVSAAAKRTNHPFSREMK